MAFHTFLFEQNKVRSHSDREIMDFLQEAGVNVLSWSPFSGYKSIINYVWDNGEWIVNFEKGITSIDHVILSLPIRVQDGTPL